MRNNYGCLEVGKVNYDLFLGQLLFIAFMRFQCSIWSHSYFQLLFIIILLLFCFMCFSEWLFHCFLWSVFSVWLWKSLRIEHLSITLPRNSVMVFSLYFCFLPTLATCLTFASNVCMFLVFFVTTIMEPTLVPACLSTPGCSSELIWVLTWPYLDADLSMTSILGKVPWIAFFG